MQKGFVFSLEALLAIFLAISLLASMHYMQLSTYSDVNLFRLANDLQQIAAKKYYSQIISFANGDTNSENLLKNEYLKILRQVGNYCVTLEAKKSRMEINCNSKISVYKNKFQTSRLWYSGLDFFEVKIALLK